MVHANPNNTFNKNDPYIQDILNGLTAPGGKTFEVEMPNKEKIKVKKIDHYKKQGFDKTEEQFHQEGEGC